MKGSIAIIALSLAYSWFLSWRFY